MTARQVFEAILVEMNEVQAPSLILEDYNYFLNKAINQYVNKRYNLYDSSQQTTDDLRVLKSTAILSFDNSNKAINSYAHTKNESGLNNNEPTNIHGATYSTNLPLDYLHILNCMCEFVPTQNFECYDRNYPVYFAARRLTADLWGGIIQNYYMRPTYKRPYYYIHNVNSGVNNNENLPVGTVNPDIDLIDSDTSIIIGGKDNVQREARVRYGNQLPVRIEIRYGHDDSLFQLKHAYIDYLKAPQHIRLTQAQVDLTRDTSQVLEFPDYVVQEIINEAVILIMENARNPRLQTTIPTHQSIASPSGPPQQKK